MTGAVPEKGSGARQAILSDVDVRRWYESLARGARSTADNYLRILGRFLELNDLTPASPRSTCCVGSHCWGSW